MAHGTYGCKTGATGVEVHGLQLIKPQNAALTRFMLYAHLDPEYVANIRRECGNGGCCIHAQWLWVEPWHPFGEAAGSQQIHHRGIREAEQLAGSHSNVGCSGMILFLALILYTCHVPWQQPPLFLSHAAGGSSLGSPAFALMQPCWLPAPMRVPFPSLSFSCPVISYHWKVLTVQKSLGMSLLHRLARLVEQSSPFASAYQSQKPTRA